MSSNKQLRRTIQQQRRAVDQRQANRCAELLARQVRKSRLAFNSQRVAAYLPNDGEIDPWPLLEDLWQLGKKIYLPVLAPFMTNRLWFARFEPGDQLVFNRYGIPEPERRDLLKPGELDLVFTPLVAFDGDCNRLGMGGAFYDRSFAFLGRRNHLRAPKLVGLAYDLQRQARLATNRWDIPLDAVITESSLYRTHR